MNKFEQTKVGFCNNNGSTITGRTSYYNHRLPRHLTIVT